MSKRKKLGMGFNVDVSKVNFLKGSNKVNLSIKELNVLSIACELKKDNILESLVKSTDKEECRTLALAFNEGETIDIIIGGEILTRSVIENYSLKVEFSLEQSEFLIQALEIYIDDLKMNFKGIEDDNFNELCVKLAEAKAIEEKICEFIKVMGESLKFEKIGGSENV